jgi:hypothetical protein
VEFQNGFQADETEENHVSDIEDLLLSEVSARDLIGLLSQYLSHEERAVLNCLTEGLGPREIGRRLKMSHTMAVRHRSKIAKVLLRLDQQWGGQRWTLAESVASTKNDGYRTLAPTPCDAHAKLGTIFAKDAAPVLRAA